MQFFTAVLLVPAIAVTTCVHASEWQRHTIDNTSRGADGVRLADVNGDGRLDIATGWEEGGVVRIYLKPTSLLIREPWPMIQVGQVQNSEDAVFADVDADGHLDVVSCCEGKTRAVYVHWNPGTPQGSVTTDTTNRWPTSAFPQLKNRQPWMYCLPMFDADQAVSSLVVGSKGGNGEIGMLIPTDLDRRDLSMWRWQQLRPAGWIMSIQAEDVDQDGLTDIVYSDRRQSGRGLHWLKRPQDQSQNWEHSTLGGQDREVMFLSVGDLNSDGRRDIVSAARHPTLLAQLREEREGVHWSPVEIPYPDNVGTGKGVAIGDVDGDSTPDLVCTCENSNGKTGVFWLSCDSDVRGPWAFHDISGPDDGIKFDRVELLDIDEDGDLDVLTCEERDNLGVIWYENPLGVPRPHKATDDI